MCGLKHQLLLPQLLDHLISGRPIFFLHYPRFSVIRGGDTVEVTHAELVVGDIAEFKYGNTFPVDGILVQVNTSVIGTLLGQIKVS